MLAEWGQNNASQDHRNQSQFREGEGFLVGARTGGRGPRQVRAGGGQRLLERHGLVYPPSLSPLLLSSPLSLPSSPLQ